MAIFDKLKLNLLGGKKKKGLKSVAQTTTIFTRPPWG